MPPAYTLSNELAANISTSSTEVDDAIKEVLPDGVKTLSVVDLRTSRWAHTSRIDVELVNESTRAYFMKVMSGTDGERVMRGSFESSKTLKSIIADIAPAAIGWGTFKSTPDCYFFLQDYHELREEEVDVEKVMMKLSLLHRQSMDMHLEMKAPYETSATPMFGFHAPTASGWLVQENPWMSSWEKFYAQGTRRSLQLEMDFKGPRPEEMECLLAPLFEKVIPRLLRPMETGGRQIRPCLMHGDFWLGNMATDTTTNEPILFDMGCFWGHNEMDLRQVWRKVDQKGIPCYQTYLKYFGEITFPPEDFEARLKLYELRGALNDSALGLEDRTRATSLMQELVDAYPRGYEEL